MKFFTIVIPTYNSCEILENAVFSVLKQDFPFFELLILDGGSSDPTPFVISKFNDPRIVFFSEKDLGVYDAMNKGIKQAQGEWIYFLGSDDRFYDEFVLSRIFKIVKTTTLPVIYGNVLIDGNTGWAEDGEIYAGRFSKNRMLIKSICHQAIFYRRDFLTLNELFFDLRYPVSADWHLNLRSRRLTRFKYVDLIVAEFTAGGISTTKRDSFSDQIKTEFADMFPSKLEIFLKEIVKIILRA